MKKKIGSGIIAVSIIAGAFVFANSGAKKADICPDRPGCICSKATTEQTTVAKPIAAADTKEKCQNKPGCVCK